MIGQEFQDSFKNDLLLLQIEPDEASQIMAQLDEEKIYLLSAALSFLQSIKTLDESSAQQNRLRILGTFFVIEAFVNALNDDPLQEPHKKLAWLLKEYLNEEEIITLLDGFAFSEPQPMNSEERKPLYHIMRNDVAQDIDYLRRNVLGTLNPCDYQPEERQNRIEEEKRMLAETLGPTEKIDLITGRSYFDHRECTAPCNCRHWLRLNLARRDVVDEYLERIAERIYWLRNSMAHHSFPVHFGVGAESMTMVDRCVWRSKSGQMTAISFAVTIGFSDLTKILEAGLTRSLIAYLPKTLIK